MLRIYLAAPFFNEEEINRVKQVEQALADQIVFSPRLNQLPQYEFGSFEWRTNVFRNDINHIKWADALFAISDHTYGDMGTAAEIGFAYAIGKPIFIYNPTGNILNLMLTDMLHGYFESIEEIEAYDFELAPAKPYMKDVK